MSPTTFEHTPSLIRTRHRLLFACCAFWAATICRGEAETSTDNPVPQQNAARFNGGYWAQIYPNRDFERGCVIGYLAFEFSPTGYFIFNRKTTGSWRIDELGNLKLRTRDGASITLTVSNDLLRPASDLGLIKRANLYQKCPS